MSATRLAWARACFQTLAEHTPGTEGCGWQRQLDITPLGWHPNPHPTQPNPRYTYLPQQVEYAPCARCKCTACCQLIGSGLLRLGVHHGTGLQCKWRHG